jgi:hypothetical protein
MFCVALKATMLSLGLTVGRQMKLITTRVISGKSCNRLLRVNLLFLIIACWRKDLGPRFFCWQALSAWFLLLSIRNLM